MRLIVSIFALLVASSAASAASYDVVEKDFATLQRDIAAGKLLALGSAFEQATHARRAPRYIPSLEGTKASAFAPAAN